MNLVLGFILLITSGIRSIGKTVENTFRPAPTPTPLVLHIVYPTVTPTPTIKPIRTTTQSSSSPNGVDWSVQKVDEHTTDIGFPPDSRMATADELFDEINHYRQSHGLNTVQKDQLLCQIAQTRADQLQVLGKLDDHAGFGPLAHQQQSFNNMAEIIEGGVQPNIAVHIVEWGWDRSLTGHREAMQNPGWTHGCGGIAGYFAVFIFGSGHI